MVLPTPENAATPKHEVASMTGEEDNSKVNIPDHFNGEIEVRLIDIECHGQFKNWLCRPYVAFVGSQFCVKILRPSRRRMSLANMPQRAHQFLALYHHRPNTLPLQNPRAQDLSRRENLN
jgi:hypothetical protein